MELSSPGTFAPESENDVELSLPESKMACNFHSTPCPKIVVATNCTHGEQGSQDVIPCTRPVEACRPSEVLSSSEDMATVDTMGQWTKKTLFANTIVYVYISRYSQVFLKSVYYKSQIIHVGERKFRIIFALGNESSRGRKFQGTKVPWSESTRERKYVGTKVP